MQFHRWIPLAVVVMVAAYILLSRREIPPLEDPEPDATAQAAGLMLTTLLKPAVRMAFDPVVEEKDTDKPASKFGGLPWLPAKVAWPVCPGCKKPMHFFAQLDLASLPEEAGAQGKGLIQLFLCTEPDSKSDICIETFEHGAASVVVRLVDSTGPGANAIAPSKDIAWPPRHIVDWKPLQDFPRYQDLELAGFELDAGLMEYWKQAAEGDCLPDCHEGDKLGGWPFWVQGSEYGTCRECGKRMNLVLQIDSEDNVPFMFGDAGVGHVCQCPDHPHVLTWGWACY